MMYSPEQDAIKQAMAEKEHYAQQDAQVSSKLSEQQVAGLKKRIHYRDELEDALRQVEEGHQVNILVVGTHERGAKEQPVILLREENLAMMNVSRAMKHSALQIFTQELENISNEIRAIVRS